MNALAWLRSRPRRHSDAALPQPTAERMRRIDDATVPTGFITVDEPLTEAEAEQVRTALQAAVQHIPVIAPHYDDEPLPCGCIAIYSTCHCGRQT